jgi:hypothetical protein
LGNGIGNTAVSVPTDDNAEEAGGNVSQPAGGTLEGSVFLQTCAPITHAEVTEKLKGGGYLRAAVLEAQDDSTQPKYAVFLLVNWRKGYCVLHVHWPARPRLYRDLDRLLVLIRFEYKYTGTIALKRASDTSGEKRHWRVTL